MTRSVYDADYWVIIWTDSPLSSQIILFEVELSSCKLIGRSKISSGFFILLRFNNFSKLALNSFKLVFYGLHFPKSVNRFCALWKRKENITHASSSGPPIHIVFARHASVSSVTWFIVDKFIRESISGISVTNNHLQVNDFVPEEPVSSWSVNEHLPRNDTGSTEDNKEQSPWFFEDLTHYVAVLQS